MRRPILTGVTSRLGALRLPYGAVMATGAAAQVAAAGPLHPITLPLLLLTLGEALFLLVNFTAQWRQHYRQRTERACPQTSSPWWARPERQCGLFIVPVGYAVIASGFSAYQPSAALFLALFAGLVSMLSAAAMGCVLKGSIYDSL